MIWKEKKSIRRKHITQQIQAMKKLQRKSSQLKSSISDYGICINLQKDEEVTFTITQVAQEQFCNPHPHYSDLNTIYFLSQ